MPKRVKITGARGSWFADVCGQSLPVLHNTWWTPPHQYHDLDIGSAQHQKKYSDLISALQQGDLAVIQKDQDAQTLMRAGYIGVFRFEGLIIHADGNFQLRITERIADPK